jgi:hypothetical protein
MSNQLGVRFQELTQQAETIEQSKRVGGNRGREGAVDVDGNAVLNWTVKAKGLLSLACGQDSQHFKHFTSAEKTSAFSNLANFQAMISVFAAAKEDFEGGYLSSVRTLVQAELFNTELEQATELLDKGYKVPAAVIAGTVLETGLRELCNRASLPVGKLDKMNADLAKAGTYNLLRQKQITALAEIRNKAAHGKPTEFTDADVKAMIADVERFLLDHLT